jgi:phosphoribosylformimino-5-aminoimidazole carboxamide ribotide isomerase
MPPKPFTILPVLDVKAGIALHAVRGDRRHYQPVRSVLAPECGSVAIELARAYRSILGLGTLYLADLDALSGHTPQRALYRTLEEIGLELWIDAGLQTRESAERAGLIDVPNTTVVVGLETVANLAEAGRILELVGPDRTVFSLDLFDGRPLSSPDQPTPGWASMELSSIIAAVLNVGYRRLLILDLARVGTSSGTGTRSVAVLEQVRASLPGLSIAVGGGIANVDQVHELRRQGASTVLLGTALHNGRIGRLEIDGILERRAGASEVSIDR